MKTVPLSRGYVALVDDADFEFVSWFKWRPLVTKNGKVFAIAQSKFSGKWETIYMHRLILGAKEGQTVRHRDNDGLNNQRENLVLT